MTKRLTRTGNSLALVLDKPLLDALRIDANTPLEVSTDGEVIIVSPVRDRHRTARLKKVDPSPLTTLVQGVAGGRISKAEIAVFVRRHTPPR